MRLIDDLPLFDRWALCVQWVGAELWVGAMTGQIVALDTDLEERRRWQTHDGSVHGILRDGTTYGGDGLVKDRSGVPLAGPYRKPVSKVRRTSGRLYIGTYERALYIDAEKHPNIAAWHVLNDGCLALVRQTGRKAGDLGPIELEGKEVGPPAWSLEGGQGANALRAFLKDGRFVEISGAQCQQLPWDSLQGPPTVVQDNEREFFIGNHLVREVIDGRISRDLRLKTKGLYGGVPLPDNRLAIAAADGNLKVIDLVA